MSDSGDYYGARSSNGTGNRGGLAMTYRGTTANSRGNRGRRGGRGNEGNRGGRGQRGSRGNEGGRGGRGHWGGRRNRGGRGNFRSMVVGANGPSSDGGNGGAAGGEQLAECQICFHPPTRPVVTQCGHLYCQVCIGDWLSRSYGCPVCRRDARRSQLIRLFVDGGFGPQRPDENHTTNQQPHPPVVHPAATPRPAVAPAATPRPAVAPAATPGPAVAPAETFQPTDHILLVRQLLDYTPAAVIIFIFYVALSVTHLGKLGLPNEVLQAHAALFKEVVPVTVALSRLINCLVTIVWAAICVYFVPVCSEDLRLQPTICVFLYISIILLSAVLLWIFLILFL
eukprot:GHVT01022884.1.p1 GENE.GHVT01022884.1~~GHVT01022884.1.p1  ORF type:complete len:340 (-),score=14.13 GHVT01022884.1:379-1398(-)